MSKKRVYSIISHTHWDREWYLPFEQFRIRLTDLIDNLLDILERDDGYRFHLDAQTVVLEDYLEIRPYRRAELEKFVKEGRLLVGPWYVQNDFHLTSGEATVRNLIIGSKIANSFGARMDSGYAADQFGLISQLPQILSGFGYDTCIFGRGYSGPERQFYWESEDGSKVLCEHMRNWYNNLQRLPRSPENALAFIRERGETCSAEAKGSSCLLMNGVDHLEAQEDLTEIIEDVRPMLSENEELIQDTMPEYMERLKKEIEELGLRLVTYAGEMRGGGQPNVLTGTLSSRVYLKQHNVQAQSDIEGRFEPQYAFLDALGLKSYPKDYATYLWKMLIQNHPHDSICGCSTDAVHRHMEDRSARLLENLAELDFRADECYMQHLDRTRIPENGIFITCVNNEPYRYDGVIHATVDILESEDTGGFKLYASNGKEIPFEVCSIERGIGKRILSPINLPGVKNVNRYVIAFRTRLASMARKTLVCIPCDTALTVTENLFKRTRKLENEFLRVIINPNGTVNLTDKKSGITYENTLMIEDSTDNGDLYRYVPNTSDPVITSENVKAKVEIVRETKLIKSRRITYTLDTESNGVKHALPVEILFTLRSGSKQLEVSVTLDNRFGNHRTRVLFPTDTVSDKNYAGQPYDIIERNKISEFAEDLTHPNTAFVGIDGEDHGVALLNEALYEYEHMTDSRGTLALTLLRSTGVISGYMADAEVPDGQCIGKHTLKLAVYPYTGDRTEAGVALAAERFISPPYATVQHKDYNKFIGGRPFVQSAGVPEVFYRPLEHPETVLPLENHAFDLTQNIENAMMLTAYKGAEDGCGQVIRLYNTTSENVSFEIKLGYRVNAAYLTTLNEDIEKKLTVKGGKRIALSAKPKQIITLKVIKQQ